MVKGHNDRSNMSDLRGIGESLMCGKNRHGGTWYIMRIGAVQENENLTEAEDCWKMSQLNALERAVAL